MMQRMGQAQGSLCTVHVGTAAVIQQYLYVQPPRMKGILS